MDERARRIEVNVGPSSPNGDPATPSVAEAPLDERPGGGLTEQDRQVVTAQLSRPPRSVVAVAHRCPCGNPDVVETAPLLPDGTPFPTLFYLTCPKASSLIGTLEASGLMARMTSRLADDPDLAARYQTAHEHYLARRAEHGEVPQIQGISAGGMPARVKCLHVLVAHALAAGPGVNPLGDEALELLDDWWAGGPCVPSTGSVRSTGSAGLAG